MKNKLETIQVFRGLAALIVVLHHINASSIFYLKQSFGNGIFKIGWLGVDFFFVLSGFIIVYAHYNDLLEQKNIKRFFFKRILRIYPTYWIIASIYLFLLIFSQKISFNSDSIYIIKSYLLLPQSSAPFLRVAWSLIYEMTFYIVFGIGLFFGLKKMKYVLFIWLSLIIISSISNVPFSNYLIFNNYILEFLFGCIIAYQLLNNRDRAYLNPKYYILLGLMILISTCVLALFTNYFSKSDLASRFGYGIAFSLIIFGASCLDLKRKLEIPNYILLLGNASYALYLIHPIILGVAYKTCSPFLVHKSQLFQISFGIIIAVIAIIIGIIFHITIEKKRIYKLNSLFLKNIIFN